MIMDNKLIVGGIYSTNWDERPVRVLAFDDHELFYDCYLPELKKWSRSGNIRTFDFYRISSEYFLRNSKQVGILELSEKEHIKFKLNFPFRFCRIKEFNFSNFETIVNNLQNYKFKNDFDIIFNNKIILSPRTKKGAFMKGESIEIKNIKELLTKTKELQEMAKNLDFNGIGFFRSGIINNLPSYYIGEYIDLANIMK